MSLILFVYRGWLLILRNAHVKAIYLQPIFHQNANPLRWGINCFGLDLQHETLALPIPTCWYLKTITDPTRTLANPMQTAVDLVEDYVFSKLLESTFLLEWVDIPGPIMTSNHYVSRCRPTVRVQSIVGEKASIVMLNLRFL